MKLLQINPTDLKPNPWNTNNVSMENEEKLRASLERHDMFKPIVCRELADGTLEILGGQHRAMVSVEIGKDQVPVINLGSVDDLKAKEISLIDNARYGVDDTLDLAELLKEIQETVNVTDFMPFVESDLNAMFASADIDLDDLLPDEFEATDTGDVSFEDKPTKTHTIMRFKVPIEDAERIDEIISDAQRKHGFDDGDALTRAGDALVHVLLS
jgi:ParB family transcriptional regulator, chromosome partitioning protein